MSSKRWGGARPARGSSPYYGDVQMVRFDRLSKQARDLVNYSNDLMYISVDGKLRRRLWKEKNPLSGS